MILFIDDETSRSARWRQALAEHWTVEHLDSAEKALREFDDSKKMQGVDLVVLDLAMYTAPHMSDKETDLGRLTGDALRKRLRETGWKGPVIVLTNSRDDNIRLAVERDGDVFARKPEVLPSAFVEVVRGRLPA